MIIYVDMDDVLCNYTSAYREALKNNPGILFPQSQYGFFLNLEPITNAIETVSIMRNSDKYTPYILTAPSIKNPFSYTEKRVWVEKFFGSDFVDKLIICSNKSLLKGDVLIDDNIEGKGQEDFKGQIIHFGSDQYHDWRAIQTELGL